MAQTQASTSASHHPAVLLEAKPLDDESNDYALGCECAYPTLQIERWAPESAAATSSSESH